MAYQFNEWQEKWLQALESGRYQQTIGTLRDKDGYCCLGIAALVCGLAEEEISIEKSLANLNGVKKLLNLRSDGAFNGYETLDGCDSLACMNDVQDVRHKDFKQIAAFIRANPEKVFTDAV